MDDEEDIKQEIEDEEEEEEEEEKSERVDEIMTKSSQEESEGRGLSPRPSSRLHGQILQDIQKQKRRRAKLAEAKEERRRLARAQFEHGIEVTNFKIPDESACTFDCDNTGLGGAMLTDNYKSSLVKEKRQTLRPSISARLEQSSLTLRSSKAILLPLIGSNKSNTISHASSERREFDSDDDFSLSDSGQSSPVNTSRLDLGIIKEAELEHHRPGTRIPMPSLDGNLAENLKCCGKIRFSTPGHIKKRLTPPREIIPWFNGRLSMSSLPVRFEIPMDVRKFEKMEIKTYLCKYCKIPKERMSTFKYFYKQHKSPKTHHMTVVELTRAIHDLLYESVSEASITKFLRFLQVDRIQGHIELKTFAAVAATAERILYLSFAESSGRETSPGYVRPFLESADFSGLKYKLEGISIEDNLRALLNSLG